MVQVLLKVIDGMTIDIALQVRVEEVFFFLLLRPGKNSKTPTNSLSDPFSLSPSLSPFFLTSESSSSLQKNNLLIQVMQEANDNGTAVVVAGVAQPEAEKFCEGLRSCGLVSSIEPAGGKGEGGGGAGGGDGGGAT